MRLFQGAMMLALLLPTPALAGIRVWLVPFDNGGAPEHDQLGLGLQSMMSTDLSQDDQVTVIERARLKDLVDEMELAQDGVVDPITAAKMGKAVGATHLVSGSFVILGDTMRLDARLINVATAESKGASVQGEKDAFFELEKTLVRDLLKVIGAELTPKERAAISRIHTADFESFSKYSKGIALFEANRYDEALQVLRQVSSDDTDFKLAEVTADAVQDAQKRAGQKAIAARVVEAEGAFVARQESALWEAEQLRALRKVAFDADGQRADRVSAAMELIKLSGVNRHGSFHELKRVSDRFALKRLGDRAYQVVYALLDPEVPRWFPRFSSHASMDEAKDRGAEYAIERTRSTIFESSHLSQTLAHCKHAHTVLNDNMPTLWLPRLQTLDLAADQLRRGAACSDVKLATLRDREREIAGYYAREGEIGKATAILDRQAKASSDAGELERIARMLGDVEKRAKGLEAAKSPEAVELVRWGARVYSGDLEPEELPHALHYNLRRRFAVNALFFLNQQPMWLLSSGEGLGSGPRTASDSSRSLRHYGDTRAEFGFRSELGDPDVAVLGGMAVRNGTMKVDLIREPTSEWHPHASRPDGFEPLPTVARAGVLVGIADIQTPTTCDPVDESKLEPHPLTAIAAFVDGDALVLARVRGVSEASCNNVRSLEGIEVVEQLGRRAIRKADGTLSLSVKGRGVTAKFGRATISATLTEPVVGFYGLWAEGEGYVELVEPAWN